MTATGTRSTSSGIRVNHGIKALNLNFKLQVLVQVASVTSTVTVTVTVPGYCTETILLFRVCQWQPGYGTDTSE